MHRAINKICLEMSTIVAWFTVKNIYIKKTCYKWKVNEIFAGKQMPEILMIHYTEIVITKINQRYLG